MKIFLTTKLLVYGIQSAKVDIEMKINLTKQFFYVLPRRLILSRILCYVVRESNFSCAIPIIFGSKEIKLNRLARRNNNYLPLIEVHLDGRGGFKFVNVFPDELTSIVNQSLDYHLYL